jgi:hypothetical protein
MGGFRRRLVVLVVGLGIAPLASCSKPSSAKPAQADPPRAAGAPGAPGAAKPDDDLAQGQKMLDMVERSNAMMRQPYDDEQRRLADQTTRLTKLIDDAEALIDAGDLDRAELKAAAVHWTPDATRGDLSEPDRVLVRQYDEQRETLLRIIRRKGGKAFQPCPPSP